MNELIPLDEAPLHRIILPRNHELERELEELINENRNIRRNNPYPNIKIKSKFYAMRNDNYRENLESFNNNGTWINMELRFVNLELLQENVHDDLRYIKAIRDIRDTGNIYPIRLSENENGSYSIIDGMHRIAACKLFGYKMIPALVYFICCYYPDNGFDISYRKYDSEESD